MSEAQARSFRIMAVGYAVLRDLSDEVGPRAVRAMTSDELTEGDLARSLGRAALAAVEATAEEVGRR
jgi:hypothetical protein